MCLCVNLNYKNMWFNFYMVFASFMIGCGFSLDFNNNSIGKFHFLFDSFIFINL